MDLSETLKTVYQTLHNNLTRVNIDDNTEIIIPTGDAVKQTKKSLHTLLDYDSGKVDESLVPPCQIIVDCVGRSVYVHIGQGLHTDDTGFHHILQCDKEVVRIVNENDSIHYYVFPKEGYYYIKNICVGILEGAYHDIPKTIKHPMLHYVDYCNHLLDLIKTYFIGGHCGSAGGMDSP